LGEVFKGVGSFKVATTGFDALELSAGRGFKIDDEVRIHGFGFKIVDKVEVELPFGSSHGALN